MPPCGEIITYPPLSLGSAPTTAAFEQALKGQHIKETTVHTQSVQFKFKSKFKATRKGIDDKNVQTHWTGMLRDGAALQYFANVLKVFENELSYSLFYCISPLVRLT